MLNDILQHSQKLRSINSGLWIFECCQIKYQHFSTLPVFGTRHFDTLRRSTCRKNLAMATSSSGLPTFLYVFDFSYGLARWIGLGDFHGSELPFVFRNWLECLGRQAVLNYFVVCRSDGKESIKQGHTYSN